MTLRAWMGMAERQLYRIKCPQGETRVQEMAMVDGAQSRLGAVRGQEPPLVSNI